jgi:anti-sigma B factor antagonist
MTIEIRQEEQGDFRVLALAGRLDTETAADLELALQDLQAAGANKFLIDLADIGYVSSAGLRVLLALAKQLDGGRGVLRLCSLNDAVKQVFDVAGFSQMFAIFPDRDAALAVAAPGGAARPAKAPSESGLAKRAATLLGAGESATPPSPESAELARAAAELLGAGAAKNGRGIDKSKPAPPQSRPAPAPTAEPAPAKSKSPEPPSGLLGKVKSLFGKK